MFEIIHCIFATHSLQLGMNLYLVPNSEYHLFGSIGDSEVEIREISSRLVVHGIYLFFLLTATKINLVSEQTLSI